MGLKSVGDTSLVRNISLKKRGHARKGEAVGVEKEEEAKMKIIFFVFSGFFFFSLYFSLSKFKQKTLSFRPPEPREEQRRQQPRTHRRREQRA